MAKLGGTKGWLVLSSVAVLMTLAVVPALAGAASASPAPVGTANSPSNQWAYGGMGWSNNTLVIGNERLTWNASFGWTVIFTSTNTSATTVQIEEQRTLGIDLTATFSSPAVHAQYSLSGHEVDVSFANLTDAATVYVGGSPVAALGINNDSTSIAGAIAESISVTKNGTTQSANLDITGSAHTSAQFTPALGLIPLNLSGVTMWNSTSTINPEGSWNITWTWANNGFDGRTGSGTQYANGTVSAPGPVQLTGFDVTKTYGVPVFEDHLPRHAIVLIVQGPLGNYDAFVLVPRDFDLFGTENHPYAASSLGSASISAETLFVSDGARGPAVTAGATTFGADTTTIGAVGSGSTGTAPAAASSPGTTVTGGPMSVAQAQAENNQLTGGPAAATSSILGAGALVVVAAIAVVALVGTGVVVEWRSYARRRSETKLVGGYGESWPGGVPPAASAPQPPAPTGIPASGPTAPEDPPRRL